MQGNSIAPPIFHEISNFSEGLAAFAIKDENNKLVRKGFMDANGQIIFEIPHHIGLSYYYSSVESVKFNNGRVRVYAETTFFFLLKELGRVRRPHAWGALDREGRLAIPFKYYSMYNFSECLAMVQVDDSMRHGFINTAGRMVIKPEFYDLDNFSEGLASAKIKINGKKGYINRKGKIVIKPQFDRADRFWDGLAKVRVGNKLGYIDRQGEFVWSYYLSEEEEEPEYW